ncbi:enolase 1, chloroplastic-like [Spinacia oleracea]|uniref:phosphopyruvate hydratase n=1 Tax=Spinacia oleracea TaxID=3562 RepID=A0ABM3R053_SPIOL|nr:enolase 1, chloroplastic-like [Spinacia oleracea]
MVVVEIALADAIFADYRREEEREMRVSFDVETISLSVKSGGTMLGTSNFNGSKKDLADDFAKYNYKSEWFALISNSRGISSPYLWNISILIGVILTPYGYSNGYSNLEGRLEHYQLFNQTLPQSNLDLTGIIKAKYGQDSCNVGDKGSFTPNVQDNRERLILLMEEIEKAGYTGKIKIGMDVAASEFYTKDRKYDLDFKKQPNDGFHVHTAQGDLGDLYKEFIRDFPTVSIEDPFGQDDWNSWASLQSSVDIQLVGDDLLVTNPKRIAEGIEKKACNLARDEFL